jgi:hypothetical protein
MEMSQRVARSCTLFTTKVIMSGCFGTTKGVATSRQVDGTRSAARETCCFAVASNALSSSNSSALEKEYERLIRLTLKITIC